MFITERTHLLAHATEKHANDERASSLRLLARKTSISVASQLLRFLGNFITLRFACTYIAPGNDPRTIFLAVALANSVANISCVSVLVGMTGTIETLCNNYVGHGQWAHAGTILRQSYLLMILLWLVIALVWTFAARPILSGLPLDTDLLDAIVPYVIIRLYAVPFELLITCNDKFLTALSCPLPSLFGNMTQIAVLYALNLLFVHHWNYGYLVLGYTWMASLGIAWLVQSGVAWFNPLVHNALTAETNDIDDLVTLPQFLHLALPGIAMDCAEWWAYEIITLTAACLGVFDGTVQVIFFQLVAMMYLVSLGMGSGTAALVANALGAHDVDRALWWSRIGMNLAAVIVPLLGCFVLVAAVPLFGLFSEDSEVLRQGGANAVFLAAFVVFDGFQCSMACLLRGVGMQQTGMYINVGSFYGFGLPLALVLCFYAQWRADGLLIGLLCGVSAQAGLLAAFMYTSYDHEVREKQEKHEETHNVSTHV